MQSKHSILPKRQVTRVNGNAVVLVRTALTDVLPSPLLLTEIQTCGIWHEENSEEETSESEPGDDPEAFVGAQNVIVEDGGGQCTQLASGSRHTVTSGSHRGREHLGSQQEGGAVGTELVPEGREEVDELEDTNVLRFQQRVVEASRDEEEDEVKEEAQSLHPHATEELPVDRQSGSVVTGKLHTHVTHGPKPVGGNRGVRGNNFDEVTLENFVAVKHEIVAEPSTGRAEETMPVICHQKAERHPVIALNLVDGVDSDQLPGEYRCTNNHNLYAVSKRRNYQDHV